MRTGGEKVETVEEQEENEVLEETDEVEENDEVEADGEEGVHEETEGQDETVEEREVQEERLAGRKTAQKAVSEHHINTYIYRYRVQKQLCQSLFKVYKIEIGVYRWLVSAKEPTMTLQMKNNACFIIS